MRETSSPTPEDINWEEDVDPRHLDINRLTNAHEMRQKKPLGIPNSKVVADSIEEEVFREAYKKTQKDRQRAEKEKRFT